MIKRNFQCNDLENQPSDSKRSRGTKANVANVEQPTTTFLHLHNECIYDIFKILPLKNQIKLALVCSKLFKFYFAEIAPRRKKFSKEDVATMCQLEEKDIDIFFRAAAHYIEEVDISGVRINLRILLPLFKYLRNVKEVHMRGMDHISNEHWHAVLHCGQSVQRLDASKCDLKDEDLRMIGMLANLTVLRLDSNEELTGKYLSTLFNLEELYLTNLDLHPRHLQAIARYCNRLRILDVRGFDMNVATSRVIAQNCRELETIRFSDSCEDCSYLVLLPRLRAMAIQDVDMMFLSTLVKYKAEQLEDLRIVARLYLNPLTKTVAKFSNLKTLYYQIRTKHTHKSLLMLSSLRKLQKLVIGQCRALQDDILLEVLQNCTDLHYMAVLKCPSISQAFVIGAIELLKARRVPEGKVAPKPFVLVIYKTAITDSILETEEYLDASQILRLHLLKKNRFDFFNEFPYDI